MAAIKWFLLAMACLGVQAFPEKQAQPPVMPNVFLDEQLEGEVFEYLKDFSTATTARNEVVSPFRLPTTTKPYHYNIDWVVDTTELTFGGAVAIQLYATEANVGEIVIHSDELDINNVTLTRNGVMVATTNYYQSEYDFLRIQLVNGSLDYNQDSPTSALYVLTIQFEAELRNDMYGIYRSWFRNNNPDEVPSYMASTQFQATSARRAFPCYDEPSFKATFDISITRRRTVNSWSNMRKASTVDSGTDFQIDTFHRTPVMSTYLLALIVADYTSQTLTDAQQNVLYEVIARPAAMANNQYQYSFTVGLDLLQEMSNHTGLDFYSMDTNLKMTQASIPDFGAGAMENWGLLTYREAYLMYDESHTNSNFKQIIAYILSHEIAHMWFGNLVTCDWWDVLWLNEGFARYYQFFLTDWVETDMGFETRFITNQVHTALLSDSVVSAHPLTNPGVGSPASVSAMFSTISYNKGAAIIRMTEHLLGFEVHREGLRRYLNEREFDVALPIHLFEALQAAAVSAGAISEYGPNFSVVDYYKTWTEQAGHPVLNVQVDHQTGQMFISQRRFDLNNGHIAPSMNWIVPITFVTANNINFTITKPTHIMTEATLTIDTDVRNQWVLLNTQQTGFYRVNYDDYTWNLIALALQDPETRNSIHEYNKAQIVDDLFQFARSRTMSYRMAFSILSFLREETQYSPWVAAITGFNWLRNRFASTNNLQALNNLIVEWAQAVMADVSYYPSLDESFMTSFKRMQLAPTMCAIGVTACREAATAQFQALVNNGVEVPVDSRPWVYCNALRDGPVSYYTYLWERFRTHPVYTEKIVILSALGCTPHEEALTSFLDNILEENYLIRRQDYTSAFNSAVTGNEANTQIVFRYVQNNLEKLEAAFNVTTTLATPLSYISARLRTEEEIEEFILWARQNRDAIGAPFNAIVNGAESARASIAWVTAAQDDVLGFIQDGGETFEVTEQPATTTESLTTVSQPSIENPTTPELPQPDSAVTSALSVVAIIVAAIVNLAL